VPGRHGLSIDKVGVIIIQDKHIVVAKAGGADETAGLVSEDLAWLEFNDSCEAMVGDVVWGVTGREIECHVGVVEAWGWFEARFGLG